MATRFGVRAIEAATAGDFATMVSLRGTDVIGKQGLEQHYEKQLHGTTGFEQIETSAGGRAVRRLGSQPAAPGAAPRASAPSPAKTPQSPREDPTKNGAGR